MTLLNHELDEVRLRVSSPSADVTSALARFSSGEPLIVGRDSGCVMVVDALAASTSAMASLVRHGSGMVFVAMTRNRLRQLDIPKITSDPDTRCPESFVAVDAAKGVGTGISAADRAETVRRLGNPLSTPETFNRPGHVIPVGADLHVGTVPAAPQVALMCATLTDTPNSAAAYTALVSVSKPCEISDPREGARIAAELGLPYIAGASVIRAFYES